MKLSPSLLLAFLVLGGACGRDNSQAKQGQALVEAISRLDPSAPATARRDHLKGLSQLPLDVPELAQLRDLCLGVHLGLLEAEVQQATAQQALAERPDAKTLPPAEAAAIGEAIKRSDAALEKAQVGMPKCQAGMQKLIRDSR